LIFKTAIKIKENSVIIILIIFLGILSYRASEKDFIIIWLSFILFSIFFVTIKEKNIKKFLISLSALMVIYKSILAFFNYEWWWYSLQITHLLFIVISVFTLLFYIFKNKYLWWLIFSPVIPMTIMYILEEFYPCLKPIGLGACG